MQSQSLRNAITARGGSVARAALCATVFCASQARAQLRAVLRALAPELES